MKGHILEGHIVLVSPQAQEVPVYLRGQMATVIAVSRERGSLAVHVAFDDKGFGAFDTQNLLILKPPRILRRSMTKEGAGLSADEQKLAGKIVKLLELDEEEVAFRHAVKSKKLRALCLTSCLDWIRLQDPHKQKNRRLRK